MKTIAISILAAAALAVLTGCESMGFNPHAVDEALTPNVDATTTVRTWEKAPDGSAKPVEKEVPNSPAFE